MSPEMGTHRGKLDEIRSSFVFMRFLRWKPLRFAMGIILAAVFVVVIGYQFLGTHVEDRVYLIGWQHVPPFQQQGSDGEPSGLAVTWCVTRRVAGASACNGSRTPGVPRRRCGSVKSISGR